MLGECSSLCYTHIQCQSTTILVSLLSEVPLDGQTLSESGEKFESEARNRNLPPCGCKSMTDGPRNMLGVFITLLYTYTMPINYYSSKPTSLRHLREEKRQRLAVKVWWRALQRCWECSGPCYIHIQCQTTTILAPTCWHTTTWRPDVLRKPLWENETLTHLRQEILSPMWQ